MIYNLSTYSDLARTTGQAFDLFDTDGSGEIDSKELKAAGKMEKSTGISGNSGDLRSNVYDWLVVWNMTGLWLSIYWE